MKEKKPSFEENFKEIITTVFKRNCKNWRGKIWNQNKYFDKKLYSSTHVEIKTHSSIKVLISLNPFIPKPKVNIDRTQPLL